MLNPISVGVHLKNFRTNGIFASFVPLSMIWYNGLFVVIMAFGEKDINGYSFIDNLTVYLPITS